jgi:hypothetical protein
VKTNTCYDLWVDICNQQAWTFQSQIIILEGFLRQEDLFPAFTDYAREVANMDNSFKQ